MTQFLCVSRYWDDATKEWVFDVCERILEVLLLLAMTLGMVLAGYLISGFFRS